MGKIVIVNNVIKSYHSGTHIVPAVKGVSLSVDIGEIVIIIGKSGSGKSTLLNIIGGLLTPDNGEVILNGKSIYGISERERAKVRGQECGFIFQSFNLIQELSVLNNIRLPFDIAKKKYDKELEKTILRVLEIEDRRTFYPSQLSGGERQRVSIARAILMKPAVILADEPSGNLDVETGRKFMEFVKENNEQYKQTYIIVTHDMEWRKVAHRTYKMKDGELFLEA